MIGKKGEIMMIKRGITKREREVTDMTEILRILDTAKVVHIAMVDGDEPYVVPMNYGYTMENGNLTFYVHGAVKGRKTDVLAVNPKVFLSLECDMESFDGPVPCRFGMGYASLMAAGKAEILEDVEEKKRGLSILMKTQTGRDFEFDDGKASIVNVIRIKTDYYTAKKRPIPPREK